MTPDNISKQWQLLLSIEGPHNVFFIQVHANLVYDISTRQAGEKQKSRVTPTHVELIKQQSFIKQQAAY